MVCSCGSAFLDVSALRVRCVHGLEVGRCARVDVRRLAVQGGRVRVPGLRGRRVPRRGVSFYRLYVADVRRRRLQIRGLHGARVPRRLVRLCADEDDAPRRLLRRGRLHD